MATQVFARRSFDYGPVTLDVGQVTELKGFQKDGKLLDLGYLDKVMAGVALPACGYCGNRFVSDSMLTMHGRKRHPDTPRTEVEQALAEEADERVYSSLPLNMDKTAAERGDRDTPIEVAPKRKRGRPPKNKVVAS